MPEESNPQPSQPRRHRPRLTELARETTEDDLWDLDAAVPQPVDDAVEPTAADPTGTAAAEPAPDDPASEAPVESASPEVLADETPAEAIGEPAEEPAVESGPEPEAATEFNPKPVVADAPRPSLPRPNRREWISLGALAAIFLGLGIWWIVGQFSDIPTQRLGSDRPDLPAKGEYATVATAETYWREPIRSGEGRDVARAEVSFIPVVSIKLSGGTGALRAIYRNESGGFVGDSITRAFENGRFVETGGDTIEFPATDGYETDGEYNGYRVGDARWTVEILEGPGSGAAGSRFQSLFTAPVATGRR